MIVNTATNSRVQSKLGSGCASERKHIQVRWKNKGQGRGTDWFWLLGGGGGGADVPQ